MAAEVSLSWAGVGHHRILRPGAVALSLLVPSHVLLSLVNPPRLPTASVLPSPCWLPALHFKWAALQRVAFWKVVVLLQQSAALSRMHQF